MLSERLLFSAAAAMAVILILSVIGAGNFAAILIAVLVHEFGHLTALGFLGFDIIGIHAEICGFRIDYSGLNSLLKEAAAAMAGPLAGLVLFVLAKDAVGIMGISAEFSLLYSGFNMLPVLPLDGGRALYSLAELIFDAVRAASLCRCVSFCVGAILLVLGLIVLAKGEGAALFSAGVWILLMQS